MTFKTQHFFIVVIATASAFMSSQLLAQQNAGHNGRGNHATGLVKEVLDNTLRFQDVSVAMAEGYGEFLGCVSGPQEGAMGVHFVNGDLVGDPELDAARPEILVYEPLKNGRLRLVAVEYLVLAEGWHASNELPPTLSGQVFHYSGSPNRYGLPPFYALHVWAWKNNPHGAFVDWNPKVSCADHVPASFPSAGMGGVPNTGPRIRWPGDIRAVENIYSWRVRCELVVTPRSDAGKGHGNIISSGSRQVERAFELHCRASTRG